MKTLLFSSSYMDGIDAGGTMFQRVMKFAKYYKNQRVINFDKWMFYDNGSTPQYLKALQEEVPDAIIETAEHLERGADLSHPYAWRAHTRLRQLTFEDWDKIIYLETDCFLISEKVCKYINGLSAGYTAFFCPKYNFPEGAINILCKDSYKTYQDFINEDLHENIYKYNNTVPAETFFPFTNINKEFVSDRFGENRVQQRADMDIYCQTPVDIEIKLSFLPINAQRFLFEATQNLKGL